MSICKNERSSAKISASGGHFFGKVLKKIKSKNLILNKIKGEKNMLYLIFHLLCAIASMIIQKHDSYLDVGFFALFLITGPIGLVAKIVSEIV